MINCSRDRRSRLQEPANILVNHKKSLNLNIVPNLLYHPDVLTGREICGHRT
jgi:hypothetical protein